MLEKALPFLIFILVGGGLFAGALFAFFRTRRFLESAQQAQGTVIQMVYSRSSKGGGGYSPVYSFRTINGQEIVVRDNLSSNPPMFQVGQQIEVLYDPENPQNARINKWMNLYFVPALLGFMGIIFGGLGSVLLVANLLGFLN